MEINILHLLEGARQARGLTVIIDVFRAFSTACYAVDRGAGPVFPVGSLEEAFRLKEQLELPAPELTGNPVPRGVLPATSPLTTSRMKREEVCSLELKLLAAEPARNPIPSRTSLVRCSLTPRQSRRGMRSPEFTKPILVGERDEQKPEGFDYGNSPALLLRGDIRGRVMIHTTSSGTQGIVNAVNADEIITGSFVNAGAIVRYIRQRNPSCVSLVCMGYACRYPTDEDTLCAEYIRNELRGVASNLDEMKKQIRNGSGARFFEESSQAWAPTEDFDLCLALNRFEFILKVEAGDQGIFLRKIDL